MSRRKLRALNLALRVVSKVFGVHVLATSHPRIYEAACQGIQDARPQHIFPFSADYRS